MSTRSKYYCERVLVRSDDRVTGTAENFSIRFNQSLDGKYKVHWITIPNTLYNVNVTNNRVYTNGAVDYYSLGSGTFEIPHGNYTGTFSCRGGDSTQQCLWWAAYLSFIRPNDW